jgi:hypothetical protein
MKVISLGFTCYLKSLILRTIYASETDIFDWCNSFYFSKLIESLEDNFCIGQNCIQSPLDVDKDKTVLYNIRYEFRIPHEQCMETYKRRYERFQNYKHTDTNYLFLRIVNMEGRYGKSSEELYENYNDECYHRLMKFLPPKSRILLLIHKPLDDHVRQTISKHFYVIENCINPEYCFFGDKMSYATKIIQYYEECFQYIENTFDTLDTNILQRFIHNDRL